MNRGDRAASRYGLTIRPLAPADRGSHHGSESTPSQRGGVTAAGWKNLPSWYIVSEQDNAIPPDAERFMAKRVEAVTESVNGGAFVGLHASPEPGELAPVGRHAQVRHALAVHVDAMPLDPVHAATNCRPTTPHATPALGWKKACRLIRTVCFVMLATRPSAPPMWPTQHRPFVPNPAIASRTASRMAGLPV